MTQRGRTSALALVAASLLFLFAGRAEAETLGAPAGGRPIALGEGRVACRESLEGGAWKAEPDGRSVRPPAREEALGHVTSVRVAASDAECAKSAATVGLVVVGPKPAADPAGVSVDVDDGRLVVRGKRLRGAVLSWSSGGKRGSDVCAAPETSPAGEKCTLGVPRDLPADASTFELALLPAGAPPDAALFDATGRRTTADEYALRPTELSISRLLPLDASLDVSSGTGRLALVHAEAVASVDCTDARCDLEGRDLVVSGEHGSDDKLDVRVRLRPHVTFLKGTTSEPSPTVQLSLQRCPVVLASAPPLAGAADQRIVLRVGGSCLRGDTDFDFQTPAGAATLERSELVGKDRYYVVRVGHVDAGALPIRLRRRGTIVGLATVTARPAPAVHAALEIPGRGAIDFIPTNRWVRLLLPAAPPPGSFEPSAVAGAYDVRRDAEGIWIRGAEGATGAAFVRFAYVDHALPEPLRDTRLSEISEPVDRALRVANVPVTLGGEARAKEPLVELSCGDGAGHAHRIEPSVTASIPYRARDTCQLVLHRERLRDDEGAQAFQVSVQVASSDGAVRSDARLDRRLVLKRAALPTYVAIAGVLSPFDRILVRVAVADDETHYAVPAPEKGIYQVQWSVVAGTDHVRLYGTAAIPTGLFRVADQGHSGILTLSVGALLRAVLLSREGTEFPLGLEAGVMWLGIAGDTDPSASSRGAVALVAGPGIGVPIANVTRLTQTSISLHAWFEYEVSRDILGQNGRPFGFVFGPSISIGDVGTNF